MTMKTVVPGVTGLIYLNISDLLVEVLVGLLQVKEDLFGTLGGRSSRDPVVDASQKLLEQRLQLRLVFRRQLRHL